MIDAASTLEDLALPHFGLHELKGDRTGTWAVKVKKPQTDVRFLRRASERGKLREMVES